MPKKDQLSREERAANRKQKSTLHRGFSNEVEVSEDMEIAEELEPAMEPPKYRKKSDVPDKPN